MIKGNTATLPPVKNVDANMLKKLRERMPVSVALLVRTGLTLLANMSDKDFAAAIRNQAEQEKAGK